jgi:ferredoxin
MKQIDERDIMFARMAYRQGTKEYDDYYANHSDKKAIDDALRAKPSLCSEGMPTYHALLSPAADANFILLSELRKYCEGNPAPNKTVVEKVEITTLLKNLGHHYGAVDVGMVQVDDLFFYSHRGRHPEIYGEKVDNSLNNAIVFTVKMNPEVMNTAPQVSACIEASKAYVDAAIIGLQLSYYIRQLGYNARCHMDGNYLVLATPLAVQAGLGQVGRNGLLLSKTDGCCVRIGVVTTNLPLENEWANNDNTQMFCKLCGLCAKTCPAKTISTSNNPKDWKIDQEACYTIWRSIGTDCGICISACPIGQGITVEEINVMTESDMCGFIEQYKKENGTRKYRKDKYFL